MSRFRIAPTMLLLLRDEEAACELRSKDSHSITRASNRRATPAYAPPMFKGKAKFKPATAGEGRAPNLVSQERACSPPSLSEVGGAVAAGQHNIRCSGRRTRRWTCSNLRRRPDPGSSLPGGRPFQPQAQRCRGQPDPGCIPPRRGQVARPRGGAGIRGVLFVVRSQGTHRVPDLPGREAGCLTRRFS